MPAVAVLGIVRRGCGRAIERRFLGPRLWARLGPTAKGPPRHARAFERPDGRRVRRPRTERLNARRLEQSRVGAERQAAPAIRGAPRNGGKHPARRDRFSRHANWPPRDRQSCREPVAVRWRCRLHFHIEKQRPGKALAQVQGDHPGPEVRGFTRVNQVRLASAAGADSRCRRGSGQRGRARCRSSAAGGRARQLPLPPACSSRRRRPRRRPL